MLSADTKDKLLKQLEFYFSDSNLPRDKFLRGKTQEDPEGFVDLNIICAFTRVAKLFGHDRSAESNIAPNHEVQQVAEILKHGSQELLVSEDGKRVKRAAAPVSLDDAAKQADERSLFVAPFPYNANLDVLTDFFNKEAPVNAVRLRRHITSKDFRGSIFVEFASQEDANKVSTRQLEFEGAPLRMLPKLAFIQQKIDDRHAKAVANGHRAPTAAAPTAQAVAAVCAASTPQAPAVPSTSAPASQTAAADTASLKRQADAQMVEPAAKRVKADSAGPSGAAQQTEVDSNGQGRPDWLQDSRTVAKFVFQAADQVPQATSVQMLRESFGGPKAGIRNFSYTAGQTEGHVRFNTEADLDAALQQLAQDSGQVLLAGCHAIVSKNKQQ